VLGQVGESALMEPLIDKDVLDRLVARGRQRGHVTTDDLRQALPVGAMSADEIALVVVHLEDQGVPVELDESLTAPHPGPRSVPPEAPELALPSGGPEPTPARGSHDTSAGLHPTPVSPPREPPRGLRPVHWAVILAGLLVVVLFILAVTTLGS
jgi:hypothetical protein